MQLMFIAFDILMVDGKTITHLPLSERQKYLASAVVDSGQDGMALRDGTQSGVTGQLLPLLPNKVLPCSGVAFSTVVSVGSVCEGEGRTTLR